MKTITIDQDLCSHCNICSNICPSRIIDAADELHLPLVPDKKSMLCINCGHCEVSCPSGALTLNFLVDDKHADGAEPSEMNPDVLGQYLKRRRSVRHYTSKRVEKATIQNILDIVRYAASGGNRQPVQWIVVYDEKEVQRLAGLTIDWMRYLSESKHPMSVYTNSLITTWDHGIDPICRNAPHLLIAHIPGDNPSASTDAIIALTHFDIVAPAFDLGACWAGFLSMAALSWDPLKEALALPTGRVFAYALMFGYPQYKIYRIPRRNPVQIIWR